MGSADNFTVLLKFQLSELLIYVIVAFAPATVNPAPFASLAFELPLANVRFKSAISTVVEFTVVVVP